VDGKLNEEEKLALDYVHGGCMGCPIYDDCPYANVPKYECGYKRGVED